MDRQVIVPLCPYSKPCFIVCSSPVCQQKPFMCGYQGCRCQFSHQKCQKPLNWKQFYEAIKIKGFGTPQLKAYFDSVSLTIQKGIQKLVAELQKINNQAISIGLQSSQKDLANAILSGRFEIVSSLMISQALEELKAPSIPLSKAKSEVDSQLNNINKQIQTIITNLREMCTIKIQNHKPLNDNSPNTSEFSTSIIPKINTLPPNIQMVPPKIVTPQQPVHIQQKNPTIQHYQRPPIINNIMTSSSPPSVSISEALRDLNVSKPEQPVLSSAPISQESTSPPISATTKSDTKQEANLKKFISMNTVEMEVDKKKHIPTNQQYDFSKVNYLKLKGCSYMQAKVLSKYLSNLTKLSLYNCNIAKQGAIAVGNNLNKLSYLDLTGNLIGDLGLKAIAEGIAGMQVLGLTGNEITDEGASFIASNLKNLLELRLAYNKVTEKGAIQIAQKCQKLNSLDINNSKYSQQAKQTIRKLLPKRHISL